MITGKFFMVNGQPKIFPPKPPSPPLSILPAMTLGGWGDPHLYISTSSVDSKNRTSTKIIAKVGDNKSGSAGNNELMLLNLETTTHTIKVYYTNKPWQNTTAKIIDNIRVEYNGTSTTYNTTTKVTIGPATLNIAKIGSGANGYLNFEITWAKINNVIKLGGAIVPILKRVASSNGKLWDGGDGAAWDGIGKAAAPYGLNRSSFETGVGIQSQSSTGDLYFSDVVLLLHADGNFTDFSGSPKTAISRPGYNTVLANGSPKFGSASFALGGNGDAVQVTSTAFNRAGSAPFTFEMWFKRASNSQAGLFLVESFYGSQWDSRQFKIFVDSSDAIRWNQYQGGSNAQQSGNLGGTATVGQWHHLAVCREEGGAVRVYLNGSLLGSIDAGTAVLATNSGSGNADLLIGDGFNGEIDEVRFTNVNRYTGSSLTVPTESYPNNGIVITSTEELVLSEKEADFLEIASENFTQDASIFDIRNLGENGEGDNAPVEQWDTTTEAVLPILAEPAGLEGFVDTYYVGIASLVSEDTPI